MNKTLKQHKTNAAVKGQQHNVIAKRALCKLGNGTAYTAATLRDACLVAGSYFGALFGITK